MILQELFGKKSSSPKRTDITAEERAMIKKVFPSGSNADMKMGNGEYVLPQNIHVTLDHTRVNFYKDGDQLLASIEWYSKEQNPGDPKSRPLTHTEQKINDEQDLRDLKKKLDGDYK